MTFPTNGSAWIGPDELKIILPIADSEIAISSVIPRQLQAQSSLIATLQMGALAIFSSSPQSPYGDYCAL